MEVKHGPGRLEVLNAGNPGYNSYQGLMLLRTKLRDLDPDLITVRFGWNDHLMSATSKHHSSAFREPANPFLRGMQTSILQSAIYQFAMRVRSELDLRARGQANPSLPDDWQPAMSIEHYKYALCKIAQLGRTRGAEVWFLTAPQAFHDVKASPAMRPCRKARSPGVSSCSTLFRHLREWARSTRAMSGRHVKLRTK